MFLSPPQPVLLPLRHPADVVLRYGLRPGQSHAASTGHKPRDQPVRFSGQQSSTASRQEEGSVLCLNITGISVFQVHSSDERFSGSINAFRRLSEVEMTNRSLLEMVPDISGTTGGTSPTDGTPANANISLLARNLRHMSRHECCGKVLRTDVLSVAH